jgi:transcriptional regulator with XRE-family HTH domain
MKAKKERLTRSQYSPFKRRCELLRVQKSVTMEEMALDLGMFTETQAGTRKGQQARLSQYENRPDGPPWDIVVQYADYFGLEGAARFDFFIEALGSAKKITVDVEKVKGVDRGVFIRFIAGVLTFERPQFSSEASESNVFEIEKLIKEVFPQAFIRKKYP